MSTDCWPMEERMRRSEVETGETPDSPEELPDDGEPHVVILWPRAAVAMYAGVIVESWDHKRYGRVKRAYLATFDDRERAQIAKLYARAYGWVMRTGYPDHIYMKAETYRLLVRAANFFASQ